ncbi:MAG: hypothetical protein ACREFX_00850 [Opitutaceae bacterium]
MQAISVHRKIGKSLLLRLPMSQGMIVSAIFAAAGVLIAVESVILLIAGERWIWAWIVGLAIGCVQGVLGLSSMWALRRQRARVR